MKNGVLLIDSSPSDGTGPFLFYDGAGNTYNPVVLQFMDSPGTTSPTTYTIQARSYSGSGFAVNPGNPGAGGAFGTSTMVLTEVIQ